MYVPRWDWRGLVDAQGRTIVVVKYTADTAAKINMTKIKIKIKNENWHFKSIKATKG